MANIPNVDVAAAVADFGELRGEIHACCCMLLSTAAMRSNYLIKFEVGNNLRWMGG